MGHDSYLPCSIEPLTSINEGLRNNYDTVCVLDKNDLAELTHDLKDLASYDNAFDKEVSCFWNTTLKCRVVHSPIGKLNDFDDVRKYATVAGAAIARAIKAGAKNPILVLPNKSARYQQAALSALLGALEELYQPIQYREAVPDKAKTVTKFGIFSTDAPALAAVLRNAIQYEMGRFVARDIGGGDPERMAAPNVATYVQQLFPANSPITVNVISDPGVFKTEFPLFDAVNRAASVVQRHCGRIIFLEYKPPKPAVKTLMLVGKGVTYDTGGADIKAGGIMAGMSRDKCGAAAVAGFMKIVAEQKPENIHVIGAMCMVRNSVGEECYVSDEVITSRAGVRVRVGNTDAEGRMCMADALCKMKEMAVNLPDPHLFTIATLTGHAVLAVGPGYSIVMDNGPARATGHGRKLKETGEIFGDPFEISTLRSEDFEFHSGKTKGEDVLQANNLPSSKTPRGHQAPAAFMILATGLDKHGLDSDKPLKYSHLDIAGSAGDFPNMPTGAPIIALAETHL